MIITFDELYRTPPTEDASFMAQLNQTEWPTWVRWGSYCFCRLEGEIYALLMRGDPHLWRFDPSVDPDEQTPWVTLIEAVDEKGNDRQRSYILEHLLDAVMEQEL